MKPRPAPPLEERRAPEFRAEMEERARAWIAAWGLDENGRDFGRALVEVAARFNSEVAERLDQAGDRMQREFLDWLAVRSEAARPARVPVAFKLADAATQAIEAPAPVQLQADTAIGSVVFETEQELRIVPGTIGVVVGADGGKDEFYLPPPGLSDLEPLQPVPTEWQTKSFASADSATLQLDPETGLVAGMIIAIERQQYRIVKADKDLVTIEPPLVVDVRDAMTVRKVTNFAPFGGEARNSQEHALYLGDADLLNIDAAATIDVVGAQALGDTVIWQYWGKAGDGNGNDPDDWHSLDNDPRRQDSVPDAVALKKRKGAVVPYELWPGKSSRWIRAHAVKVDGDQPRLRADALAIRVNYQNLPDCKLSPDPGESSPLAEGMANTTPLVLDNLFFPLGKEPRQFDAFYLGSQEAFSKPKAEVQVCFDMADPTFSSLTNLKTGPEADRFVAGVARDGCLHLLKFDASDPQNMKLDYREDRKALRPPSPGPSGKVIPSSAVALDGTVKWRVPVWAVDTIVSVAAATSTGAVWIWKEDLRTASASGWKSVGLPARGQITGLVYLGDKDTGGDGRLLALCDSKLYVQEDLTSKDPPAWMAIEIKKGENSLELTQIAPIQIEKDGKLGDGTEGLVGIATDGALYHIPIGPKGGRSVHVGKLLLGGVSTEHVPAAVRADRSGELVVVAIAKTDSPWILRRYSEKDPNHPVDVDLKASDIIGNSIDLNVAGDQLTFAVCVQRSSTRQAVFWKPFGPTPNLYRSTIPSQIDSPTGGPTLLTTHVLVPMTSARVDVAPFETGASFETQLLSALITKKSGDLAPNDIVAIPVAKAWPTHRFDKVGTEISNSEEKLFEFNFASIDDRAFVYRYAARVATTNPLKLDEIRVPDGDLRIEVGVTLLITTNTLPAGSYKVEHFDSNTQIAALDRDLDVSDPAHPPAEVSYLVPAEQATIRDPGSLNRIGVERTLKKGNVLLITTDKPTPALYKVISFRKKIAKLDRDLEVANPATPPAQVDCLVPEETGARLQSLLYLDATSGKWDPTILDQAPLIFLGDQPESIQGTAFTVSNGCPEYVTLSKRPPDDGLGKVKFRLPVLTNRWVTVLGDPSINPELSWEYWNGKSWSKLHFTLDETQNLKTSGAFQFTVPRDMAPSDWVGKTNYWIRARLIAGDYGKETVKVTTTKPDPNQVKTDPNKDVTIQTVDRSSEGIHAPAVLRLRVSYRIGEGVQPAYVLTQDSGTTRDQSDANRTGGAIVEAFVPLSVTLGRLSKEYDSSKQASPPAPGSDCREVEEPAAPVTDESALAAAATSPTNRALFVGLTGTITAGTVNLLFLVDKETERSQVASLNIDALVADRFVPVVAEDATRAFSESGLVVLSLAVAPTHNELFGNQLTWLRLRPRSADADWIPSLRGAYLNGMWTSSQETLTRELLGSSDGSPHQTVRLARPPALHDTLELRVLEPLGQEERDELRKSGENIVRSDVEGLPGDWVLWKQVIDPNDETALARVYALEEATGEVRFGDGVHGRIPPIGRDSIVAFRYCRTEPDPTGGDGVPGNTIGPRAALNLVSPLETVEGVSAAGQAAGGAPPESSDRAVRFGIARLRHRGRAITARDVEDLALQSSPDIVQARALVRRAQMTLVIVMRGKEPQPNAAQMRELRRLLTNSAPVSWGVHNALHIQGPRIRKLRVELTLRIDSLNHAGSLGKWVKEQLIGLFDSATGGLDRAGWKLGASPRAEDIAVVIGDAPYLESIEDVQLREITEDGRVRPWSEILDPTEIVMLDSDPVRIQFETVEVSV